MTRICGGRNDDDGCGGEEKERKTKAEVDGQCKCGLYGEGTLGGGKAKQDCVEETCRKHRPHNYV